MGYYGNYDWVEVPGYEVPSGTVPPIVGLNYVTSDYFPSMGIQLLEGRSFSKADDDHSPWVAIVNEAMANKFWPNQSAIGHEFHQASIHVHSLRVVGVVKNSRTNGMIGPIREYFYAPLAQQFSSLATVKCAQRSRPKP